MPRIAAALGVFVTLAFAIGFNTVRYPAVWNMVAPSAARAQAAESPLPARPEAPDVATGVQPASPSEPAAAMRLPAASPPSPPAKPVCDPQRGVCQIPADAPKKPPERAAKEPAAENASPLGWPTGSAPDQKAAAGAASKPRRQPATAEKPSQAAKPPAAPKKEPDQIGMLDGEARLVPVVRPRGAGGPATAKEPSPPAPTTSWCPPLADEGSSRAPVAQAGEGSSEIAGPGQSLVVRLPPVDESDPGPAAGDYAPTLDGQIPIYPTTGVQ